MPPMMRSLPANRRPASRPHGFSLIELMVGVALGLVAVLVISQVFANAEGQKRTTTGGSDAQVTGALALYALQRDLQMAGYGLTANPTAIGCTVKASFNSTAVPDFLLVPARITAGTSNGPDSITIFSAAPTRFSVPAKLTETHAQAGTAFTVQSTLGITAGDVLLAVPEAYSATSTCTVFQATAPLTATSIPHAANAGWNASLSSLFPTAGVASGGSVMNLGAMLRRTYSVNATSLALRAADLTGAAGTEASQDLYPQVLMLKAAYGIDSTGDGTVDSYTRTEPTTNAGWRQVIALRVAVVARSAQYEQAETNGVANWTATALTWNISTGATGCTVDNTTCLSLNLAGLDADWQRYRYKVYDTVVPLRNRVWNP